MRWMQNSLDLSRISNTILIHISHNVVHRNGKNYESSIENDHLKYKSILLLESPVKIIIALT